MALPRSLQSKPAVGTPCAKCGERPATTRWLPTGHWDLTHGTYHWWCDVCVLEAQVKHARERAAALPDLEAQLAEARAA